MFARLPPALVLTLAIIAGAAVILLLLAIFFRRVLAPTEADAAPVGPVAAAQPA